MTDTSSTDQDSAAVRYEHRASARTGRIVGVGFLASAVLTFLLSAGVSRLECDATQCRVRRAAIIGDTAEEVIPLDRVVSADSRWMEGRSGKFVTSSEDPVLVLDDERVVPLWPRRMSPIYHRFEATDVTSWRAGTRQAPPNGTDLLVSLAALLGVGSLGLFGAMFLWAAGALRVRIADGVIKITRAGFIDPIELSLRRSEVRGFCVGGQANAPQIFICDGAGPWRYVSSDKTVVRELGDALRALRIGEYPLSPAQMSATREISRSLGWLALILAASFGLLAVIPVAYVMVMGG